MLAAAALVLANHHDSAAVIVFALLTAATVAIAWRGSRSRRGSAAAVLAALVIADWALDTNLGSAMAPAGRSRAACRAAARPTKFNLPWSGLRRPLRHQRLSRAGPLAATMAPILWAASAVFAPIAILAALYYRIAGFERSIPFAGLALLLAALYAIATEALNKRGPRPGIAAAGAIFATGAWRTGACAHARARERLAHGRACLDGARRRLGRLTAAAAVLRWLVGALVCW